MIDPILAKAFERKRLEEMITKMNDDKKLNKTILRNLCNPETLVYIYELIKNGKYEISPPHLILIPKDEPGKFRECKVNEDYDRCILSLLNDAIMELTSETMIAKSCTSYQKGLSSQKTVQDTVEKIPKLIAKHKALGRTRFMLKADLSQYFDRVSIERIDEAFDKLEMFLGFEPNTLPSVNMLRKYYHSDLLFDTENNLISQYTALKQGSSVASWLADVILYDMDIKLNEMCDYYTRYSDDILIISENVDEIKDEIEKMLATYGLALNPKKLEFIDCDKWFTFLGFNIKNDMITLSKNRVKKLTKAVYDKTLAKPNISPNQAKQNIKQLLYNDGDGYSWSSACFGAMQNNEKDIDVLNAYIMDAIRLCEIRYNYNKERKTKGLKPRQIKYGMDDIGGIGVVTDRDDYTLIRGCGSKVRTARQRTQKEIDHYKSVGCLLKCYKIGRPVFEAVIKGI